MTLAYVGVDRVLDRHQIEFWVTSMVRICRQLANRHLLPTCVRLVHRRGRCSELNQFFGCDVAFGADTDEVAFSGMVKQMPMVNADPYLNKLLIKYCEELRSHQKSKCGTFRVAVENIIAPLLPHGSVRMEKIAGRLGLSPRTLARRLASEGLTFEGLLSDLRANLARGYLKDESLPISQIAWLVGYKEVSAFNHAFKRWTSKTPTEVRAKEA
jgi:AraC-like DNA-binding protein